MKEIQGRNINHRNLCHSFIAHYSISIYVQSFVLYLAHIIVDYRVGEEKRKKKSKWLSFLKFLEERGLLLRQCIDKSQDIFN